MLSIQKRWTQPVIQATRFYHTNSMFFAGHSKWNNIKHHKAKTDQQRMAQFGKLTREITSAVKEAGGVDPEENVRLRMILDKCRKANMSKDVINRAIAAGSGANVVAMESGTYEGSGANGTAVIVNILTDKKARTQTELHILFTKHEGVLGARVGYLFDKKGFVSFKILARQETQEQIEDLILDKVASNFEDAQDVETQLDDSPIEEESGKKKTTFVPPPGTHNYTISIMCEPDKVYLLQQSVAPLAKELFGVKYVSCEVTYVPKDPIEIEDERQADTFSNLISALEDHADVVDVYHNANI